jgi:hypothetical protein
MGIHHKVYEIVSAFNESMYEEIGDQEGYYDHDIMLFVDKYYAQCDGHLDGHEATDWIEFAKSTLIAVRTKINSDDHPLGGLKTKHKINLNYSYGQALVELKKLKYPNWKPLLERV